MDSIKLEERPSMISVPDEAANHLGAILLAFNREIFGGFLDEADELAALGQVTSAVLIAGTVLEYVERSPAAGSLPIGTRSEIEAWRRLRNQVAYGSADALSVQQARQVIDGVRRILLTRDVPERSVPRLSPEAGAAPHAVRGKYAHVPTSSADFIKRKREDLELENRG
jgi:hypothetical protein